MYHVGQEKVHYAKEAKDYEFEEPLLKMGRDHCSYVLMHLLNEYIDFASFASSGSWFQSIALVIDLRLLFRTSLFGLGSVRFVALFLRW